MSEAPKAREWLLLVLIVPALLALAIMHLLSRR